MKENLKFNHKDKLTTVTGTVEIDVNVAFGLTLISFSTDDGFVKEVLKAIQGQVLEELFKSKELRNKVIKHFEEVDKVELPVRDTRVGLEPIKGLSPEEVAERLNREKPSTGYGVPGKDFPYE